MQFMSDKNNKIDTTINEKTLNSYSNEIVQQNIAMQIEYDGSDFYGFQKQKNNIRTVQGALEYAICEFTGESVKIVNAGRTDTGVHATNQVINFKTPIVRDLYKWHRGINALLPKDIVVKNVALVPEDFHSRYTAISRTYSYYLLISECRSSILYKKVGWYHQKLDICKMQEATQILVGQHDFSSFRASNCQAQTAIRNITYANICTNSYLHPDIICLNITANAFLYHMVRNIVGALIYIGNGKLSIDNFKELLAERDRKNAPPTFMSDGLYFTKVEYPIDYFYSNQS